MRSEPISELRGVLERLEAYIWAEQFRGYDPYDLLTSPLFKLPVLRTSKSVRFYSQQIFRRIPINLRPLLQIQKGYNAVTLGLAQQAYLYMSRIFPDRKETFLQRSQFCVNELIRLQSNGYSGACWGYDFDWEGRYARIPAFTPTVVATGFITNGLFERYKLLKDESSRSLLESSVRFVLCDLQRSVSRDGVCFSYSPTDHQQVLNASMKAARLLAQVYSWTNDPTLRETARSAVQYVVTCQRADGSWPYSVGDARPWSDNYHTAYVLDCLQAYGELANDNHYDDHLSRGLQYYKKSFFTRDNVPKYYDNNVYPVDVTCAAQSIITLTNFTEKEKAIRVACWVSNSMMDRQGFFHYQKLKVYTHKTSYMRWSNAWMFLALAYLLAREEE